MPDLVMLDSDEDDEDFDDEDSIVLESLPPHSSQLPELEPQFPDHFSESGARHKAKHAKHAQSRGSRNGMAGAVNKH